MIIPSLFYLREEGKILNECCEMFYKDSLEMSAQLLMFDSHAQHMT